VTAGAPLALGALYHYWTCTCQGRANGPASNPTLAAAQAVGATSLKVASVGAAHERRVLACLAGRGRARAHRVVRPGVQRRVRDRLRQSIGANEPLRTGSYSTTLTVTLSTTNP
jgi:hypothetical protein